VGGVAQTPPTPQFLFTLAFQQVYGRWGYLILKTSNIVYFEFYLHPKLAILLLLDVKFAPCLGKNIFLGREQNFLS
jgi:hypothetical protein